MVRELLQIENLERISPSIIMVCGVGGGGSNAVNHMFELGIAEVTFMVCNTDRQALYDSPVPIKMTLGEGLGAGNRPEKAKAAAEESIDEITSIFRNEGTRMVFITAGMGGGTGTGAAPVIARAARQMGILTVGIVTLPFRAEGPLRTRQAQEGLEQMRESVDALLVINNESIQEIYGKLALTEAFRKADDILAQAAKGIAEIITRHGGINVDFADVQTVMSLGGVALMGSARASGEDRAMKAAEEALCSPLLNHNDITGAKHVLMNITSGTEEITLDEAMAIADYIQDRAGKEANLIWGAGSDPALGDRIEITLIATGFSDPQLASIRERPQQGAAAGVQTEPGEGEQPQRPPRWTPPVQNPQPQPPTGGWTPPQPQPPVPKPQPGGWTPPQPQPAAAQPNVINASEGKQSFTHIEELWKEPAYKRRKVAFSNRPNKNVTLKKEEEKPEASTGSLFD